MQCAQESVKHLPSRPHNAKLKVFFWTKMLKLRLSNAKTKAIVIKERVMGHFTDKSMPARDVTGSTDYIVQGASAGMIQRT